MNAREYFQSKYSETRRKFVRVIITMVKDDILKVEVVVNEKGVDSELQIAEKNIKSIINKYCYEYRTNRKKKENILIELKRKVWIYDNY